MSKFNKRYKEILESLINEELTDQQEFVRNNVTTLDADVVAQTLGGEATSENAYKIVNDFIEDLPEEVIDRLAILIRTDETSSDDEQVFNNLLNKFDESPNFNVMEMSPAAYADPDVPAGEAAKKYMIVTWSEDRIKDWLGPAADDEDEVAEAQAHHYEITISDGMVRLERADIPVGINELEIEIMDFIQDAGYEIINVE